jgi:peptide methionine sulfoxide reductase MsrB
MLFVKPLSLHDHERNAAEAACNSLDAHFGHVLRKHAGCH